MGALDAVSNVAQKQSHLPILTHVLFEVKESKVQILATDLEIAIRIDLRAKVEEAGSFTVPAKTVTDIVHLLTEEYVEVETEEQELVLKAGVSSTKIKGIAADDFPVIPGVGEHTRYTLDGRALKDALTSTSIAMAKTSIRPELSGLYLGFFGERFGGLLLAATDSYRLSERRVTLSQRGEPVSCIVPGHTVFEMIRLLSLSREHEETQVVIGVNERQILLRIGGCEMTSRLIEGSYPDYGQIIPSQWKTMSTFPVDMIVKKIKAAGLFSTTGVNAISFDVNKSEGTIGISSMSAQTGEYASFIDATTEGEENSILLNHRYLLEGLQHIREEEVVFCMNSADSPCLFRPKNNTDYLYLVMPVRQ